MKPIVVINPGNTAFKRNQLITEDSITNRLTGWQKMSIIWRWWSEKFIGGQAGSDKGVSRIQINREEEITRLRAELKDDPSALKKAENIKRLRDCWSIQNKPGGRPNKPEWMVLDVVPGNTAGLETACTAPRAEDLQRAIWMIYTEE